MRAIFKMSLPVELAAEARRERWNVGQDILRAKPKDEKSWNN